MSTTGAPVWKPRQNLGPSPVQVGEREGATLRSSLAWIWASARKRKLFLILGGLSLLPSLPLILGVGPLDALLGGSPAAQPRAGRALEGGGEGPLRFSPVDQGLVAPPCLPPDPTHVLLTQIVQGQFTERSDVALGRFLQEFDLKSRCLETIDPSQMRTLDRGAGWAEVEAPYRLVQSGDQQERVGQVQLYFVEDQGKWKLEHLRVRHRRNGR